MCPPEAATPFIFTTITEIGLTTALLTHCGGDEIGKASHGKFQNRPKCNRGGKVHCPSVAATDYQSQRLISYQENE